MDIREIAKRARVSTATVWRMINRIPTVKPTLAKRVWKVVDELGYYPNIQARALVSGRSRIFWADRIRDYQSVFLRRLCRCLRPSRCSTTMRFC
jgi:DNA-binding LacI/PurR family transcriptional regulator